MIRLENVLKTSLQDVLKMSWRRFCKTSSRRFEDVLARRIEDVFQTSWIGLKTSWKRLQVILKTYGPDEYIFLDQDVFWKCMTKGNILVLIKTSSRRLLKTKTTGCWDASKYEIYLLGGILFETFKQTLSFWWKYIKNESHKSYSGNKEQRVMLPVFSRSGAHFGFARFSFCVPDRTWN